MNKFVLPLLAIVLWAASQSESQAHRFGYVTYYQPAPVYAAPVYAAPVYAAPTPVYQTSYYAPAPAPVAVAPAPVYQPVTRVRTRYRPILGGTVTRVRHSYYAPPVVYGY